MKLRETVSRAALLCAALAVTGCSSTGPAAEPAAASEPEVRTKKPILAVAQEPVESVEIQTEPTIEQPAAQAPAEEAGNPEWWLDEPTWTEDQLLVTTMADATDLREARTAAVNRALAVVRETFGQDPADYNLTARARTLADGGYRVFVRIAAPKPATQGQADG